MKQRFETFYAALARDLSARTRITLLLLAIPLALSVTQPLWRFRMVAPQYPEGLTMDVYAYTVTGGHDGADIKEINILNHYIGMHHIDRATLSDLDWIPFAIGALVVLLLRVAVVGNGRMLVDQLVVTGYVSIFAMARFVYRLWFFGHNLDPDAPVRVAPFTPVILGTQKVANFTTYGYPQLGTVLIGISATGLAIVTLAHVLGTARARKSSPALEPAVVAKPA